MRTLVVELYNAANLPVRLYAEEGFIQILFFESDEECETSYSDRGGKYQDQQGLDARQAVTAMSASVS